MKFPLALLAALLIGLPLSASANDDTTPPVPVPLHGWFPDRHNIHDATLAVEHDADASQLTFHFTLPSRLHDDPAAHRSFAREGADIGYRPSAGHEPVVRIVARGTETGRHIRLRLVDAGGEVCDTKPLTLSNELTVLEFPLETFIAARWDGDKNGRIDWPLKLLRIEPVDWVVIGADTPESIVVHSIEIVFRKKTP